MVLRDDIPVILVEANFIQWYSLAFRGVDVWSVFCAWRPSPSDALVEALWKPTRDGSTHPMIHDWGLYSILGFRMTGTIYMLELVRGFDARASIGLR